MLWARVHANEAWAMAPEGRYPYDVVPTIPHTQPAAWPANIPSSRLASQFHASPVGCRVGLIGLPDDEGVRLNNGRPGAKDGPKALRAALAGYGVATPDGFAWP